jgi:hypothetical protein
MGRALEIHGLLIERSLDSKSQVLWLGEFRHLLPFTCQYIPMLDPYAMGRNQLGGLLKWPRFQILFQTFSK